MMNLKHKIDVPNIRVGYYVSIDVDVIKPMFLSIFIRGNYDLRNYSLYPYPSWEWK